MSKYNFTDDRREELKGITVPSSSPFNIIFLDTKGRICRQPLGEGLPEEPSRIKQALPQSTLDDILIASTEQGYLYTCRAADIPFSFWTFLFPNPVTCLGIYSTNSPFLMLIGRNGDSRVVPTSILEYHEVPLPQRLAYIAECDPSRHTFLDTGFTDGHALKLKIDKFFTSGKGHVFVPNNDFGYVASLSLSSEEDRFVFFLNNTRGTSIYHGWIKAFRGTAATSKTNVGTRGGLFSSTGLTYFCPYKEGDILLIDNSLTIDLMKRAPVLLPKVMGTAIIPSNYWSDFPEITSESLVIKVPRAL